MPIVNISEAAELLPELLDRLEFDLQPIEIQDQESRVAVILHPDEYESLLETLEVLSDQESLKGHVLGLNQALRGEVLDYIGLKSIVANRDPEIG